MNITEFSYQDKSIAMREYFAEVVAQLICESIEQSELSNYSISIQYYYRHCNSARLGSDSGWLHFTLDDYLPTASEKMELHNILSDVMSRLLTFDEYLSVDYLNAMESNKPDIDARWNWPRPIKTSNMQAIMFLLQELIAGNCEINNYELNFTGWTPNPFGYNLP